MRCVRLRLFVGLLVTFLVLGSPFIGDVPALGGEPKDPLNLALIWHQHQPLYKNTSTGRYELPWARVHAVQEYYDSPLILSRFDEVSVTYNLVPSLLDQIEDYAEITDKERKRGEAFKYIGATDPHLRLALTHPEELTESERARIQEEFFWLNGYMLDDDGDDPYYSARYAELEELAKNGDLSDQEITDLSALFFLWQVSPLLHDDYGLSKLRGKVHYSRDDIRKIIVAQRQICGDLLEQYSKVKDNSSEIITSPYYHPILPLLMSDGWQGVDKKTWPEDTRAQLHRGVERYREIFGEEPRGVWPPEQAVSQSIVRPLVDAGFTWTVTDKGVLGDTLGHTPDIKELTRPYVTSGDEGKLFVFFRHAELSNKISFSYGNKTTEFAVNDFMESLKEIYQELDNPSERLLTIAMDGENWMFMAGYPDNGRSFLGQLYEELAQVDWVNTTTPGKFLDEYALDPARIENLATGSWAGDLSTWRGEPEEDKGWRNLIAARDEVVTSAKKPSSRAMEAIYAAEGSDWFWWYGTDQDSGNDETFDGLFKTHLINAYLAGDFPEEKIPAELFVEKIPPITESLGEVDVTLDGQASSPSEWKDALYLKSGPNKYYRGFHLGYGPNNFYVRIDTKEEASNYIGKDLSFTLYLSGKSKANALSRYGNVKLGFGTSQMVSLHLEDVEEDGSWNVFRYESDGSSGWSFASDIANLPRRSAKVGEIIEFQFPYETVNVKPEENFFIRMALERRKGEELIAFAPQTPVRTKIPKQVSGEKLISISDPPDDDYGPGGYTYPKAPVFETEGLFDLTKYEIYDSGDKWMFTFEFGAMTNPWSAPLGFSHQLINLYLDVKDGGRTKTFKPGANVRFPEKGGWDHFVKVAGWPGYGREFITSAGEEHKIDVSSNVKKKRVIVGIPKDLLPKITGGHYLLVFSQDGYGQDHIRAVGKKASTWQGGGSDAPLVTPNAYDYLAPEGKQKKILGSYSPERGTFPLLKPFNVELKQD